MLYGANGGVVRSSDRTPRADRQEAQAESLREKVKAMDSLLDIVYVEWAGRYSLICRWPQGDGRWEMYRNGQIGEPYDALGWMCMDMQDPTSLPISLDDVENLVLERLASCDNQTRSWKTRMADHIEHNRKIRKDRQQIALDQVEEVTSTLWNAVGKHDATTVERMMKEISGGTH
jgi:hypothetical protein